MDKVRKNLRPSQEHCDGVSKDSLQIVNDPADESNKVVYFTNRRYNTTTMEIGGGSGEDGAYLLESGAKYRLSFRYKWAKDSGRVSFNNGKFRPLHTYSFTRAFRLLMLQVRAANSSCIQPIISTLTAPTVLR